MTRIERHSGWKLLNSAKPTGKHGAALLREIRRSVLAAPAAEQPAILQTYSDGLERVWRTSAPPIRPKDWTAKEAICEVARSAYHVWSGRAHYGETCRRPTDVALQLARKLIRSPAFRAVLELGDERDFGGQAQPAEIARLEKAVDRLTEGLPEGIDDLGDLASDFPLYDALDLYLSLNGETPREAAARAIAQHFMPADDSEPDSARAERIQRARAILDRSERDGTAVDVAGISYILSGEDSDEVRSHSGLPGRRRNRATGLIGALARGLLGVPDHWNLVAAVVRELGMEPNITAKAAKTRWAQQRHYAKTRR